MAFNKERNGQDKKEYSMIVKLLCWNLHWTHNPTVDFIASRFWSQVPWHSCWMATKDDQHILHNSSFYKLCQGGDNVNGTAMSLFKFQLREYIVDNSSYPLLPWLMTPYQGTKLSPTKLNGKIMSLIKLVEKSAWVWSKTMSQKTLRN